MKIAKRAWEQSDYLAESLSLHLFLFGLQTLVWCLRVLSCALVPCTMLSLTFIKCLDEMKIAGIRPALQSGCLSAGCVVIRSAFCHLCYYCESELAATLTLSV